MRIKMVKIKTPLITKLDIPEGCEFKRDHGTVTVKGPKGELKRTIENRNIIIEQDGNILTLKFDKTSKREKKHLFTTKAHIKNMLKGVSEGYTYKLKICSGHFPMTVTLKNNVIEIKNFIGEVVPRKLIIKDEAKVKIEGDIITVEGIDKEKTGQAAASIEKLTKRPGFDKRIFQDGIYITEKDGKKIGQ